MKSIIIVHGGAGDIPMSRVEGKNSGVKCAVLKAREYLLSNPSDPMGAAVVAVSTMEDLEAFNAGYGSVLNEHGDVEMDAAVMDGKNLGFGGVAAVAGVKNPIRVARSVMDKTPHCLLTGQGAYEFAAKTGDEVVDPKSLVTPFAQRSLEAFREGDDVTNEVGGGGTGTVGAVVMDRDGNLAAATSTGGMTGKFRGRVGDTPIIGAGLYADNRTAAVSSTGKGEYLLRSLIAKTIVDRLGTESLNGVIRKTFDEMTDRIGGDGGAIVVTSSGEIGIEWNTKLMSWGFWKEGEDAIHFGCVRGEHHVHMI